MVEKPTLQRAKATSPHLTFNTFLKNNTFKVSKHTSCTQTTFINSFWSPPWFKCSLIKRNNVFCLILNFLINLLPIQALLWIFMYNISDATKNNFPLQIPIPLFWRYYDIPCEYLKGKTKYFLFIFIE